MMIYPTICDSVGKRKLFSVLIDPDGYSEKDLLNLLEIAGESRVDLFLVGGSLVSRPVDQTVKLIKEHTTIPVLLFPGSLLQISPQADGILLLSLISGRNPEFLIGNHVVAAPLLRQTRLEIIPTGYLLIENGQSTAVEYISNTRPIPAEKTDIVIATALAGEMLGEKLIYLEAGSGARHPVPAPVIRAVKSQIKVPLVVGGGIRTPGELEEVYRSGADMAVVGNILEKGQGVLQEMASVSRLC